MLSHSASAYVPSFVYYTSASKANLDKECQPLNNSYTVLHTFSFQLWHLYIINLSGRICVEVCEMCGCQVSTHFTYCKTWKSISYRACNEASGHNIDWQALRGRAAMCLLSLVFDWIRYSVSCKKSFSHKDFSFFPLAQTKNHWRAVLATLQNDFG